MPLGLVISGTTHYIGTIIGKVLVATLDKAGSQSCAGVDDDSRDSEEGSTTQSRQQRTHTHHKHKHSFHSLNWTRNKSGGPKLCSARCSLKIYEDMDGSRDAPRFETGLPVRHADSVAPLVEDESDRPGGGTQRGGGGPAQQQQQKQQRIVGLFSSTPAKSLTRSLPHGVGADVLVLQTSTGSGAGSRAFDLRDVLYTAYAEYGGGGGDRGDEANGGSCCRLPRRGDGGIRVLICEEDAEGVARDILLLSMVMDLAGARGEDEEHELLWEVFHDLLISEDGLGKVAEQAEKLCELLDADDDEAGLETWRAGPYGQSVGFHDEESLQKVKKVWREYAEPGSDTTAAEQVLEDLKLPQDIYRQTKLGAEQAISLSGLRSAAPVPLASGAIVSESYERFWKEGRLARGISTTTTTDESPAGSATSLVPNPTITNYIRSTSSMRGTETRAGSDPATNPLLGYHLGPALARLAPGSPLSTTEYDGDGNQYDHVLASVKMQFREWTTAYKALAGDGSIRTEFCVCSSMDFLHDLADSPDRRTGLESTKDERQKRFDVIDTTSLADQHGFLDLLVAAKPLLRPGPMSVIYTETLHRRPGFSYKQNLDALMCGDAVLHSLAIGLIPVEYWTNTSVESCIDDVLIRGSYDDGEEAAGGMLKNHFLASWRSSDAFSPGISPRDGGADATRLSMDAESAAAMLSNVFEGMASQKMRSSSPEVRAGGAALGEYDNTRMERFVSLIGLHINLDFRAVVDALVVRSSPDLAGVVQKAGSTSAYHNNTASQPPTERDVSIRIQYISTDKFEMVATIDIGEVEGKGLPQDEAPVELQQSSPFLITVTESGGSGGDITRNVFFPLPVLASKIRTTRRHQETVGDETIVPSSSSSSQNRPRRIIELTAEQVDPLETEDFSDFILPIRASLHNQKKTPIIMNNHSVNLDSLPVISVDNDTEASRKANSWLATLTSQQFSTRERKERELALEDDTAPSSAKLNLKESLFTIFMLASGLQGGSTGLFTLSHPERGNQILIFVRSLKLDGSVGSVVADAAVLPITRELLDSGELEEFLLVLRELEACVIDVSDEELVLWKRLLPALVERCRTWEHRDECEYFSSSGEGKVSGIPVSVDAENAFLCSCGNGKLPPRYMGGLPEWEEAAARHAVRVAISPLFAVPWVEEVMDVELVRGAGGVEGMVASGRDRCRRCGATQREESGGGGSETVNSTNGEKRPLMRCTRCRDAMYCSQECQKKDWKKHRMECRAPGET